MPHFLFVNNIVGASGPHSAEEHGADGHKATASSQDGEQGEEEEEGHENRSAMQTGILHLLLHSKIAVVSLLSLTFITSHIHTQI